MTFSALSVVVPVGPEETGLGDLATELTQLPEAELVLVGGEEQVADLRSTFGAKLGNELQVVAAPSGRATRLNAGARRSTRPWLWFLHADSRLRPATVEALEATLAAGESALYYFDLEFNEPPIWLKLNESGARLRSRWLGLPFGDQGFLLPAELFKKLGGYPETGNYGEDHRFVWRAHRRDVPVRSVGAPLRTSPRKYRKVGWLKLTLFYQYVWWTQFCTEAFRCLRGR